MDMPVVLADMIAATHKKFLIGLVLTTVALVLASLGSAEEPAVDGPSRLRVITYNVQFLPEPVSWKNERPQPEYRARRIAEELRGFDVVALQELFHETYRDQLIEQTRTAWNGSLRQVISPHPPGFHTSGGCVLLTRRPLLSSDSMVFANFSKPEEFGLRADGHAAKGVIYARIARSSTELENFIEVFVTHMEARADALRPLQYRELAEFIQKKADQTRPVLVLGDFNTYGMAEHQQDPASQYSQLMRELNAVRPQGGIVDLWPHLKGAARGGTTEQESAEVGKRIDYILLGNPAQGTVRLKPLSIDVNLYQDERVGALSDHNAVVAELLWPASEEEQ